MTNLEKFQEMFDIPYLPRDIKSRMEWANQEYITRTTLYDLLYSENSVNLVDHIPSLYAKIYLRNKDSKLILLNEKFIPISKIREHMSGILDLIVDDWFIYRFHEDSKVCVIIKLLI